MEREFLKELHDPNNKTCKWTQPDRFSGEVTPNRRKATINEGLAMHAIAVSKKDDRPVTALVLDGASANTSTALHDAGVHANNIFVPNTSTPTVAALRRKSTCLPVAADVGRYLSERTARSQNAPGYAVIYLDHTGGVQGREAQISDAVANARDGGVIAVTLSTYSSHAEHASREAVIYKVAETFMAASRRHRRKLRSGSCTAQRADMSDLIVTQHRATNRPELLCSWESHEVEEAAAEMAPRLATLETLDAAVTRAAEAMQDDAERVVDPEDDAIVRGLCYRASVHGRSRHERHLARVAHRATRATDKAVALARESLDRQRSLLAAARSAGRGMGALEHSVVDGISVLRGPYCVTSYMTESGSGHMVCFAFVVYDDKDNDNQQG